MKIKIFEESDIKKLEDKINDWFKKTGVKASFATQTESFEAAAPAIIRTICIWYSS